MNRLLITVFGILLFLTVQTVSAEDYIGLVNKGNKAFTEKDFVTASDLYKEAENDHPQSPEIDYNLAGALYEQGKFEEAVDRYTKALNTTDLNMEALAQYNLGNTYFRMGDYQNAIKSYEETLKINPDDIDAKYNLELARKMLKEQTKPQQQDQQQQQKQKEQEQKQDEQKKEDQQKNDQQQDQQQQDQKKDDQNKDKQPQPKDEKKISKEDAERILNALKDDEQKIQKKIKRHQGGGEYNGKDW